MRIDIVSIFPDYLDPLQLSLVGKAARTGLVELAVHDLRSWTHDRHRTVDDTPYGGGAGMVMKSDPWGEALDDLLGEALDALVPDARPEDPLLLVMTPSGERFSQPMAERLAGEQHLVIACGRYEGIDARVVEHARTRMRVAEVSVGDYVLNGGEAAALVVVEALVRLVPGVIGNPESLTEESHAVGNDNLLEYPVYTKPPTWRGLDVPEVLFSGHHGQIAAWRREQAVARTRERRPDLVPAALEDLVVTRAVAADAGELWTLQQAAYLAEGRQHGTFDIPPLTETLDEVRDSLADGIVLVARRAGRLVGSVRGERREGGVWYVGRLMVAPDLQGAGLGGTLLARIEALAPEDTRSFQLVTGVLSASNVRFYRRRGYRILRQRTMPGVDVIELEKVVRPG